MTEWNVAMTETTLQAAQAADWVTVIDADWLGASEDKDYYATVRLDAADD
jgi:hypothetical protein